MTDKELAKRIKRACREVDAALKASGVTPKKTTDAMLGSMLTKAIRKHTGDKQVVCEVDRASLGH